MFPHGESEFFSSSHARDETKTSFSISLPSSELTISLILIMKRDAINVAGPGSMQNACHVDFVIDLAHRRVSLVVEHRSDESDAEVQKEKARSATNRGKEFIRSVRCKYVDLEHPTLHNDNLF